MSDYIVLQKKKKCTCGKSLLTSDHMRRQDASQSQWWQLLALHMTGTVSVWCVWTRRSGHPQLQPQEKSIQLLNCLNSTVILPSKYFVQRDITEATGLKPITTALRFILNQHSGLHSQFSITYNIYTGLFVVSVTFTFHQVWYQQWHCQ